MYSHGPILNLINLPPPNSTESQPESSLVLLPRPDSIVYNCRHPLQILNSLALLLSPADVHGKTPILFIKNKTK